MLPFWTNNMNIFLFLLCYEWSSNAWKILPNNINYIICNLFEALSLFLSVVVLMEITPVMDCKDTQKILQIGMLVVSPVEENVPLRTGLED